MTSKHTKKTWRESTEIQVPLLNRCDIVSLLGKSKVQTTKVAPTSNWGKERQRREEKRRKAEEERLQKEEATLW